ncbi:MAG: c-type cytochrome biogenesis protein CcmI [Anderseniella sp.]|nr:c-type cytochrome biogenesis protein CcmI [Anderseniella sp.]
MTALVLMALLSPLRSRAQSGDAKRASFDLAVYRDQLSELERDQKAGLIPDTEADAARNEVSRRILAAQAELASEAKAARPVPAWLTIATGVAVPLIALGGYLQIGRPDLPAQPLQARIDGAVANQDMAAMVRQVEQHLEQKPNDARGWMVLAPAYKRIGRYNDAANAYKKALAISGPDADMMTDMGESLVLANNGLVSNEAQEVFEAVQQAAPKHMKARFYVALAQQQEGKTSDAIAGWTAMLAESAPDAPWRAAVEQQISSAGGQLPEASAMASAQMPKAPTIAGGQMPKGPALTEEQIQQGREMSTTDRTAMIRSMVEGLDERLTEDGADIDAWLRLIRARMVLGEKDKAADALNRASEALKDNQQAVARLEETRKALGL